MSRTSTLRTIADWLDAHPDAGATDVTVSPSGARITDYGVGDAAEVAALCRAIGGKWDKGGDGDLFTLSREIAPGIEYRLVTWRRDVCERVVVATETVTIPAQPEHTETVEKVEWRCAPLLADHQVAR